MNKQLIIIILFVALAAAGIFFYNYFRPASPAGHAELTANDLTIAVDYSRPFVRERLIFGERAQGALQPYGKYWRLGANAATEISFSRDVLFNGGMVDAGTYRMYAVPGAESFEIALNRQLGVSGSEEPDPAQDVLHTAVPVEPLTPPLEQFTISMEETGSGIDVIFEWSDVRFVVPVSAR
jgi:hypothetical protein